MAEATVIILGASTRAAAVSARRAGWTPWCADLFADADLQRIATVRKVPIDAYPHGLLEALADAPQAPVLYTGALENRPDLIAKINRPLWGNPPDTLRTVRSPEQWTRCLLERGFPCPALSAEPTDVGRWLLKPRKSAGGFGIHAYGRQPFEVRSHFLQEWIDGQPCSAVYLGMGGQVCLLGVTLQLIGTPWLNATGFHYAGSIGPLPLDSMAQRAWRQLGAALEKAFGLRGLFGVDAILRDGVPWPVEINPRYTASIEILERSFGVALLTCHRAIFEGRHSPAFNPPTTPVIHGKAILYARRRLTFPDRGPWVDSLQGAALDSSEYADIPDAGEVIEQGRPVLTLFASACTVTECMASLQEKAQALDRRLWG
ncbi:MAG: ATP-grasp domain-containing protein [Gemmataceae bacterium]|nr:ATP-grasp domain-containing protein [Gemmataceae bacterium]